jgi:hypothetical protein
MTQVVSLFNSDAYFYVKEYKDAYSNLSKSALVQESNIFNDKTLKEKKCIDLLNKVIFLLN